MPTKHCDRGRQANEPSSGVSFLQQPLLVGAPVVALIRESLRVGDRWSLSAWTKLGGTDVRPGAGLGLDPLASIFASLRFAAVAAVVATVVGVLAAQAINSRPRLGRVLDAGMMLPLGTSAVTIGLGMLITFDTAPVDWRASWFMVPLGHSLVAVPFVIRSLLAVLRSQPADLRNAAGTLGASPIRAWWHVDVRSLRRPLFAGAGFSAAISLGEFGATTVLSRSGSETLPIAIGRLLDRAGGLPHAQAFVLCTILLILTIVIVIVTGSHQGLAGDA